MASWFQRYLLPGLVFQSICIAGGYGTGRELAEFFLKYGPLGGLLGLMLPTTILVSIACMVAFELARLFRTYDYKSFVQLLLGRAWFLYEIAYLTSVLLVLAVVSAATGAMTAEAFGISGVWGTLLLLATIAFLTFVGTKIIERVLSFWSLVLYGVYLCIFVLSMFKFSGAIRDSLAASAVIDGWMMSALRYGSLQLALIPAILFATTHIARRKEAIVAGALAGPLLTLPAILFYIAMLAHYPAILQRAVPVNFILQTLDSPALQIGFQIVLIGTFIETGTGVIHGFNERVAKTLDSIGKILPGFARSILALALIVIALLLSRIGLIDLIAVGYGTMTWAFLAIFVLPLLTIGIWRIGQQSANANQRNNNGA